MQACILKPTEKLPDYSAHSKTLSIESWHGGPCPKVFTYSFNNVYSKLQIRISTT